MTRNDLMEKMYKDNPCVDEGTITIALARRFPRWQGNYKKLAHEFLKAKRANSISNNISREFEHFMSEALRFANRMAENLKGESWELPV